MAKKIDFKMVGQRIKHSFIVYYFLISAISVWLLPFILKLVNMDSTYRIVICLFIINPIVSAVLGWLTSKRNLSGYMLVIFPIIYAALFDFSFARYGIWFVPIYLIIGYLVYGFTSD